MFKKVNPKQSLPEMEEKVLKFWKENKIFEKSVEGQKNTTPQSPPQRGGEVKRYSFYDGPPFATGLPHYGHIVASVMKDAVPRYWTMRGYKVERKWGWDCHGLPIENIVEKELGSKNKKDIEKLGVEKFNENCRGKVLSYADDWKKIIERLGRWVDMENGYKTMDLNYMESVWQVFKKMWDKDLIYEGYKPMHICPRCETTLSQSEVAEGYKDIKDLSCVAKFEAISTNKDTPSVLRTSPPQRGGEDKVYILAWTTTPWTLIGNVVLAVNPNIKYQVLSIKGESGATNRAEDRIKDILKDKEYKIIEEFKGEELIGKKYKPPFDYYYKDKKLKNRDNGWKIYGADFVTTEEGTGVVHIAPAFGEDDMALGKKEELPFIQHIGMDGIIKKEAGKFAGLKVKPKEDYQKTDVEIIKYLARQNLLFSKEKYEHSYPHCWRCDTPLINYATSSWFVNVSKVKKRALELAKEINWSPAHIKEGRFGNWLENAHDWSISRQRFWASVIPVWVCDKCGEKKVIGSVEEIRDKFGNPNLLYLIRHGQANNNIQRILMSHPKEGKNSLTEKGKKQIEESAKYLKNKKIDIIFSSPIQRTMETAEIISKKIRAKIIVDERLTEVDCGKFEGKSYEEYLKLYPRELNPGRIDSRGIEGAEDIQDRLNSFIDEINKKYKGKNIVIVSHGGSLKVMKGLLMNISKNEMLNSSMQKNGKIIRLYSKLIDLHKHIVDKITFKCDKCAHSTSSGQGGIMKRVPDVLDCWFESGAMPYAQMHYPFENKEKFEKSFPADFIAEGIDQTRTWFYYLHIIATAVKNKPAFKNVIVNGIVLAEDGKKMAKRLKNYPDPMVIFDKYGADVVRFYLLSSPVVSAQNLSFSEKELAELARGMFRMLWNSYYFFILYTNIDKFKAISNKQQATSNLLDRWIISELNMLIKKVNGHMEDYKLHKAVRLFPEFVDNLSNWYIRRSRKRFWKSENDKDKNQAYQTLHFVLAELSKLLAPFAPFVAEEIYRNLSTNYEFYETTNKDTPPQSPPQRVGEAGKESVHLTSFP